LDKKKSKKVNAKKAGFEKKVLLSPQMEAFLGLPPGSAISRKAANKELHEYIKSNECRNPKDKRVIVPDAKLTTLFGEELVSTTAAKYAETGNFKDALNYFMLQKIVTVHYIPIVEPAEPVPAV
jgi:chromatin remodeling complex protein RSC6